VVRRDQLDVEPDVLAVDQADDLLDIRRQGDVVLTGDEADERTSALTEPPRTLEQVLAGLVDHLGKPLGIGLAGGERRVPADREQNVTLDLREGGHRKRLAEVSPSQPEVVG